MPIPDSGSACVVGEGGDVWGQRGFESAKGCGERVVDGWWRVMARRGGSVERCERQDATASRTEARRRPEIEPDGAPGRTGVSRMSLSDKKPISICTSYPPCDILFGGGYKNAEQTFWNAYLPDMAWDETTLLPSWCDGLCCLWWSWDCGVQWLEVVVCYVP